MFFGYCMRILGAVHELRIKKLSLFQIVTVFPEQPESSISIYQHLK